MWSGKQTRGYDVMISVVVYMMLTIDLTHATPIFADQTAYIYVGEAETTARKVYTFSVTSPDNGKVDCTNVVTGSPTAANDNEFEISQDTETLEYRLYTTGETFNYAVTNTYTCTMTCTHNGGTSSYSLNVGVIDQENIVVTNLGDISPAVTSYPAGSTLKTVSATSVLGSDLTFSLVSAEPTLGSEYFAVQNDGTITLNKNLDLLDSSTYSIKLNLKVHDEVNNIDHYVTQTIYPQGANAKPTSDTLNKTETLLESVATGTVLFDVSVSDPDSSAFTYTITCDPLEANSKFSINSNGFFILNEALDFETQSAITCRIDINDGKHSSDPLFYTLTVADTNEAPKFSETMHYYTLGEGAKGSISFDPSFVCTDADADDTDSTLTYGFISANNSDRFTIGETSHLMGYNTDYDVDNGNMDTTVVLTVCCKDQDGLSATTQVTLTITDVNDNTPIFPSSAYTINVAPETAAGTIIGTLLPTDLDSGLYGDFYCTDSSTSGNSGYYSSAASCDIYVTKALTDLPAGTHVGYTVCATDRGTPANTGCTSLDVILQESVTTTTTTTAATTTPYNFFDHAENIAMFVFLLLALLALLGLLAWCCLKYCCGGASCGNMCDCMPGRRRRYPQRQMTPERTPRRKRRTPSPEIFRERTPPAKVRPVQYVTTVARPAPPYGSWHPRAPGRSIPMRPGPLPLQSAPAAGFY